MSLRIEVKRNDEVTVDNLDGGGNPNYIEVIEGTFEAPFGNMTRTEIKERLDEAYAGNSNIFLSSDADEFGYFDANSLCGVFPDDDTSMINFSICEVNDSLFGTSVTYYYSLREGLILGSANHYSSEDGVTEYDTDAACTITIVHHPMPENG